MLPLFIAALVIIFLSYLLTKLSMGSYKHSPQNDLKYTPFLVRNIESLNQEALSIIYLELVKKELVFSIEKIQKYNSPALVLFIPGFLKEKLAHLNLLELEDYISEENDFTRVREANTYSWSLKLDHKGINFENTDKLFSKLNLEENQQFYLQVSALPLKKNPFNFKINFRAMVVESDPTKKIELVKRLEPVIKEVTGLLKNKKQKSKIAYFKEFKKRQVDPKIAVVLNISQIEKILSRF